jgi:hypothetical protein
MIMFDHQQFLKQNNMLNEALTKLHIIWDAN